LEDATPVARTLGDIVFDRVGSHISNASVKFTATPQVAFPQPPPKLWKLLENPVSGNSLKQLDYTGDAHARVEANEQVHVVGLHLKLVNRKTVALSNLVENPLASGFNYTF